MKLGHYTTIIYFARDHDLANLFQSCPQRTQKQVNEIKCMQVCLGFVLVNRRSYEVVCPEERKKEKKKFPAQFVGLWWIRFSAVPAELQRENSIKI